jgi:hypothetical protein
MARIATIGVISFFLWATCGALCQDEHPSSNCLQKDGSNSAEVQRLEMRDWRSLPDAPSSVSSPTQAEKFHVVPDEARLPLRLGVVIINAGAIRETGLERVPPRSRNSLTASYQSAFARKDTSIFFSKYLYPSLRKRNLRYHPSNSSSFMGRATDAASRIFITRDDAGNGRLNTSYFLSMLTSVTIDSAYRPYWARSASATLNNFGSTIGSDAGINLLHEFGPGIRRILKGHAPKFVSGIEKRIIH